MTTYVLPPGAWLGSSLHPPILGTGALHPPISGKSGLHPPISAKSMLHPPISGKSVLHPPISGKSWLHPPISAKSVLHPPIYGTYGDETTDQAGALEAAASLLTVAAPWRADDPEWTWQGGRSALLAQSLQHVHAAVLGPSDPKVLAARPTDPVRRPLSPRSAENNSLWCWGSEFRVQAVQADLAWRFRVRGSALEAWRPSGNNGNGRFLTSFSLEPLTLKHSEQQVETWHLDQVDKVLRAAVQREERLPEILVQCDDLWSYFAWISGVDAERCPITWEVLSCAWQWATPLVMALKNQVGGLRPFQRSPRVLPIIPTPAHGTLPSGHATMAALTSEVLAQLAFDDAGDVRPRQLDRLARRIAFNRVVAGVHFPADSAAGYALGLQMAASFVSLAKGCAPPKTYQHDLHKHETLSETAARPTIELESKMQPASGPLSTLWSAARRELGRPDPTDVGASQ